MDGSAAISSYNQLADLSTFWTTGMRKEWIQPIWYILHIELFPPTLETGQKKVSTNRKQEIQLGIVQNRL
jgi:hypothetical protein